MMKTTMFGALALTLYWSALYSAPEWAIKWLLLTASLVAGSLCLTWALSGIFRSQNATHKARCSALAAWHESQGDKLWASGAHLAAAQHYSHAEYYRRSSRELEP